MRTKKTIEDWLETELEEKDFETVLEDFDLDPYTVFWMLFQQGMIDEDLIEMRIDELH